MEQSNKKPPPHSAKGWSEIANSTRALIRLSHDGVESLKRHIAAGGVVDGESRARLLKMLDDE